MTGGGAATNSGIDFQHRFGALVMLSVLTDVDLVVDDMGGADVLEMRFETSDGIDDVVIETERRRCLVQAKRSLSLSASRDSEYSSVIRQFVRQYVERPDADDRYVLATSAVASKRIRQDLRKLTESVRLNPSGHGGNPVSASEREVLETTRELIAYHYEELAGEVVQDETIGHILGRVVVVALDLEAGGANERAALAVAASRSRNAPLIIWRSLIALCMALSKDRQSISAERLAETMGKFFNASEAVAEPIGADDLSIVFGEKPLLCGREVVLAEVGDRYLLMELRRFNDDGTRRMRFVDGNVEFGDASFQVMRRTSSKNGMIRLLEASPDLLGGRELAVAEINSDDEFDNSPWALAHADLCQRLWQENPAPHSCLGCARPVSDGRGHLVEIDEEDSAAAAGLVHGHCLRPTHRVLGELDSELFRTHPELKDFDYSTWFRLRPGGQGVFSAKGVGRDRPVPLLWKLSQYRYAVGTWGVAYGLEDGSRYYLRDRGQVLRTSRAGAGELAGVMNNAVADAIGRGDPFCVAKDFDMFGPYSQVLRFSGGAQPLRVGEAAAVELDRATMIAHRTNETFYAPLVVLVDRVNDERLTLLGAFVLLTDPLAITDATANWTAAGFEVPDLATMLIESDDQFDAFVAGAFLNGLGVVVDPRFDMQQNLVSGVVFDHYDSVIAAAESLPDS